MKTQTVKHATAAAENSPITRLLLRLFAPSECTGFSVRREHALAEVNQRCNHGHLSPLDGGCGPGVAIRVAGYQCAPRFQRRPVADGPANHRQAPCRLFVASDCLRLRTGDTLGD